MKQKLNILFFIILFLSISICGYTQSLDQARRWYNEGQYESAKPAFEKLVKQAPSNSNYNQWYGVCCYETGDLVTAEKYLLEANKRKVMESYRYLAQLYSETYRFDKAVEMWTGYIDLQSKKKEDTSESESKMEQARNLLRMQAKAEDIQVIDSIVVDKYAFLNAYYLSDESGTLSSYNDFFNTTNEVSSTVYTNQKGDKIFYARQSNGVYSLYSQTKLLDAWGDEKLLLSSNSNDNNYPFVMTDGVTMYFASKENGSIGGYDIFITRYNTNTNSYLAPEQMGMPFNSPANDYMMVIDETKGLGWFVTDRNQPDEYVCVYLFIPDPSRKRIEDMDNTDIIRSRASLVSISDTWREGADYSELIKLAHTNITQDGTKKVQDFEFVINDKITYYTLNEIKNGEAKNFYSEVITINKQIETLKTRLDDIRTNFSKGNQSKRDQLRVTILEAEHQLYALMEKSELQEKKARNAENIHLGTKK